MAQHNSPDPERRTKVTLKGPRFKKPRTADMSGQPDNFVHKKEMTKRLSVDLPPKLHKNLKVLCAGREISVNQFVRDLIECELDPAKKYKKNQQRVEK